MAISIGGRSFFEVCEVRDLLVELGKGYAPVFGVAVNITGDCMEASGVPYLEALDIKIDREITL